MTAGHIVIPATTLTKDLTLNIRVTRVKQLQARIWLGGLLFKLGARIIGCGVVMEVKK